MTEKNSNRSMLFPGAQSLLYVNATICYVDTKNNVFDAISEDHMRFIKNCQYLKINPDCSGEISHPCSGDSCVVKIKPDGSCELERIYTAAQVNVNGVPTVDLGQYSKFMPGDRVFLAKGGSFLQLLRSGLVKIGVTPLCQMIFMKMENYTRWISRNIEILSSGVRFYSVNANGKNVTRLSIFLQDAMSAELRNKSSESSDFEICIKDDSLFIMYGPKDPKTGTRINATTIDLVKTGAMIIAQMDINTKKLTHRIVYNPSGSSSDLIYDGDEVIYARYLNRVSDGSKMIVNVNEHISGSYTVKVDGHYGITAQKDVKMNGQNVLSVAELTNSAEGIASIRTFSVEA